MTYKEFIERKQHNSIDYGIKPTFIPDVMFVEYNRWAMINNKLYCPDCYEIEDNGEIKAKPKKRKI